jgi:hypothetical protein
MRHYKELMDDQAKFNEYLKWPQCAFSVLTYCQKHRIVYKSNMPVAVMQ